ncbi:MAG: D-tagatose-bisphosphate aldolase, class II, non-catalytic subunit [Chloroflexi bacterium]|nr:D-tagatose-bisphosphate aldolase, class II, non-catalytic subunit [Chloroflexota bacterium]
MNQHPKNTLLLDIVSAQKQGESQGIYSLCSAHPAVLEAGVRQAIQDDSPLLIESTSNQVNQYGGYTGMTPADFGDYVERIAAKFDFPPERLILGGDHLGPNPWQGEAAARAMDKARVLVQDCVLAGYTKIHLDASMKCAGDNPAAPLDKATSASRAADLCAAAEAAYQASSSNQPAPCYVIGTEVPPPGGAKEEEAELALTTVAAAQETIALTRAAFKQRGLEAAWERVIAVVVQPGVEFGDHTLFEYRREAASPLARFIETEAQLIFEAHSTDYQTRQALRALVADHFAILKVGPALTFAFREAVFALALIETEWLAHRQGVQLSNVSQVLDQAMQANPAHWQKYYAGSDFQLQFARRYSFSDRSRYYWPDPQVQQALSRLMDNLRQYPAPLTLLSQFLPAQFERVRAGLARNIPGELINDKIAKVLADYAYACGWPNS